ncbi:hypothetical protein EDWATA_00842 [Edwardsiella tarda ATCC 23685]|uniref:Uncharacterized protein n=1 Tax=Edwardsiella tarda ATCC 23685 TaxID=500638 RepID=D4F298_EDWTA|nr:hypothetical protein EDWATA_00842 [Edwardsiella tarda ATCC 23685]
MIAVAAYFSVRSRAKTFHLIANRKVFTTINLARRCHHIPH